MSIESISGTPINRPLSTKSVASDKADVKQQTATTVSADTFNFTNASQDIKSAVSTGAPVPVINEDRVAAIKSAIQSGNYKADAGRVAEKMLKFEAKLPNST